MNQIQESIDLLNRKLNEAEMAHQVNNIQQTQLCKAPVLQHFHFRISAFMFTSN